MLCGKDFILFWKNKVRFTLNKKINTTPPQTFHLITPLENRKFRVNVLNVNTSAYSTNDTKSTV